MFSELPLRRILFIRSNNSNDNDKHDDKPHDRRTCLNNQSNI